MFDGFLKFSLEGTRHSCLQGQVHTNEEAQSQITMGVKADLKSHTLHALHIEDFTRLRVNESDLTAVLVETGAMPVPTRSQNPTACG